MILIDAERERGYRLVAGSLPEQLDGLEAPSAPPAASRHFHPVRAEA